MRGDVAIVGAGPGGVAAAVQCKRLGIVPVLLDQTGRAGGLSRVAHRIENYPGLAPMTGAAFSEHLATHLQRFRITIEPVTVRSVERCDTGFMLRSKEGALPFQAVIIATGTVPRKLPFPGASFVDDDPLRALADNAPHTVIIGGGEASLDFALSVGGSGRKVTLLVRKNTFKATGNLVAEVTARPEIRTLFEAEPTAIVKSRDAFSIVLTVRKQRRVVEADRVIGAIGRTSTLPMIMKGLDETALETVSTPHPGLFVIGDARTGSLGQAGMAVGDGLNAAMKARDHLRRIRSKMCMTDESN